MQQSNRLPSTLSRLATSTLALSVLMTPLLFVPEVEAWWACNEPAPCVEANATTGMTNCASSQDSCPDATVFRCTTPPGSQSRNCERLASFGIWEVCIQYACYNTVTFVCIQDLNCWAASAICVHLYGCAADYACVSLGPCTSYPALSVVIEALSANPWASVCTGSPAPSVCPAMVGTGTSPTNPSPVACSSTLASACLGLGTTGILPGPFAGSAYVCASVAGCIISASPSIDGSDVGLQTCLVYTCPTTLVETDRPRASAMACFGLITCLDPSLDVPTGTACLKGICASEAQIVGLVMDSDQDGYSNADEVMGNSDPTNRNSDPEKDDDCDLKKNSEERDLLAAQGQGHPVVRTSSPGFTIDPNLNHPTASVTTPDVFIDWEEGSRCN